MSKYVSKKFWVDAADRAASTFAQAALAVAGVELGTAGLEAIDWVAVASVAAAAAVVSLLQSVAARVPNDLTDTEKEADYQAELSRSERLAEADAE